MPAGIHLFLAVPEAGAEDARDALVPRQLYEGFRIRNPDQLRSLGTVADVVLVPVDEQVGGRAVDQLESTLGDGLPVIRRDPLADDPSGHGHELVVDVGDAELLDLRTYFADELGAAGLLDVRF